MQFLIAPVLCRWCKLILVCLQHHRNPTDGKQATDKYQLFLASPISKWYFCDMFGQSRPKIQPPNSPPKKTSPPRRFSSKVTFCFPRCVRNLERRGGTSTRFPLKSPSVEVSLLQSFFEAPEPMAVEVTRCLNHGYVAAAKRVRISAVDWSSILESEWIIGSGAFSQWFQQLLVRKNLGVRATCISMQQLTSNKQQAATATGTGTGNNKNSNNTITITVKQQITLKNWKIRTKR